jgi:hypothetical protein
LFFFSRQFALKHSGQVFRTVLSGDHPQNGKGHGCSPSFPEPNKINSATPSDSSGKSLTPYADQLPVAAVWVDLNVGIMAFRSP